MAIDAALFKVLSAQAVKALGWLLNSDADKKAPLKAATEKLQVAVLRTLLYINAKQQSKETEAELVDRWREASTAFYGLDNELAERLQLKAEYWTSPDSWTDDEVREAGISLNRVAVFTRQLLHESK